MRKPLLSRFVIGNAYSTTPRMPKPILKTTVTPALARDRAKLGKVRILKEQLQKRQRTPKLKPIEGFIDLTSDGDEAELMPPPLTPLKLPRKHKGNSRRIRVISIWVVMEAYAVRTARDVLQCNQYVTPRQPRSQSHPLHHS